MITENQKRDHALYFIEEGEDGFSPERNKKVVEDSLKKYEAARRNKIREFRSALGERTQALAFFFKSRFHASSVEKYFGKRWLAYLRGQRIREVLQEKYTGPIKELRNKVLYLPD